MSIHGVLEVAVLPVEENSQLREIVVRIVRVAQPQKIILFGSAAREGARPDSDLDILVVKDGVKRRALAGLIYRSLIGVGRAIDIVVASSEDIIRYGNSPSLVLYPALREGRVIYAA
jgi:predicted nucleotidyltransferase